MTCEIIVMNRKAVVLAADSTVTVTQYANGNKEERRYYKSVNKLFQMSNSRPVGMMIYGSGDFQQAPWELIAKEYRSELGSKSFDNLSQYGSDLFKFITNAKDIFPDDYLEEVFLSDCRTAGYVFYEARLKPQPDYQAAKTEKDKITFSQKYIDETIQNLDKMDLPTGFEASDIEDAIKLHLEQLKNDFGDLPAVDAEKLAYFAIVSIYRSQYLMGNSGVVISGFGDKDYFPGFSHYICHGSIRGKVVLKCEEDDKISYHHHSRIKGFATTNMVDTFLLGLSINTYYDSSVECQNRLLNFAKTLGAENREHVTALVEAEVNEFKRNFMTKCRVDNYEPLTRIVASLPLEDMADLAETLVRLESLKEKVTQPTESVGGPVDVATITRSEGLIWIKRKHFFDPALNPRYFTRLNGI